MKWVLMVILVFASSSGDVLCASGMSEGEEIDDLRPSALLRPLRYIVTQPKIIFGVLCYAAAFCSMLFLLSVVQLSVAIPMTAGSFIVDTLAARYILREHVPVRRWLGVLLVAAGVVLAVRSGPLTGTARPRVATIHANHDQTSGHKTGTHRLDQQGTTSEVLSEP